MKKHKQPSAIHPTPIGNEPAVQPTQKAIAAHAYLIYLARGGSYGRDLDDWLQAERELKASSKAVITKP